MKSGLGSMGTAAWLGFAALVGGGCAGDRYHQSTGEAIDDKSTSMRVRSALHDDTEYKFPGVQVVTFKGTVQLSGFVDVRAQKSRAYDIAKGVEGVHDVENGITVKQ